MGRSQKEDYKEGQYSVRENSSQMRNPIFKGWYDEKRND